MRIRPTIGFLINDVVNTYQYTIWCGVDAGCREAGFDLTVFTGGELGSTDPVKAVRAKVFELANSQNIQGLVIGAPAVGNHLSPEQVAKYCRSFAPLPVVTVGFEIPGVPTVLVNNVAGMEEAVEHLVTVHGRKRIGFIGGPPANSEAHDRIGAYRRVLDRHAIGSRPEWEAVANFDMGQAREAMFQMLDAGLELDAVVAANDAMALGALEALQKRGVRVPEEVAVCGFDDILETKFCTPPLATVRQPIFDQGLLGVRMLQEMLGGRLPEQIRPMLPANYLPRKSCGCVSRELNQAFLTAEQVPHHPSPALSGLVGELATLVPTSLVADVGPALAALELDLSQGTCNASLTLLEKGIARVRKAGGELKDWQAFVNAERRLVLSCFSVGDPRLLLAESLWHQKRVALGEAEVQSVAYQNVTLENKIREMNEMGSHFINSFDEALLIRLMLEGLPRQGIGTCYLLLTRPDAPPDAPPRMAMAMEGGRALPMPPDGIALVPGAIFPPGFVQTQQRRTLVVEPLFFNDAALGFLAYELSPTRGMVFDALRTLISAALQGARLVQQVRQRTEELEVAYSSLQTMSQQIQDILQNIEQGLFVVDLAGTIQSDCSRSVHGLLGLPDVTKVELKQALRLTDTQEADFLRWLEMVEMKHQVVRWEKLVKLAPVRELEVGAPGEPPRVLRLAYQKMSDAGKLRKIMVMVIDETESRRVARIVQAERERHENEVKTILGLVNNLPEVIQDYLDDTEKRIQATVEAIEAMVTPARLAREGYPNTKPFEPEPDVMARIFRDLHTIKGNSATYGFEDLTRIAHEAEDLLEALKPPIEMRASATLDAMQAKLHLLDEAFAAVAKVRARLATSSGDELVARVPVRKLSLLRQAIGRVGKDQQAAVQPIQDALDHLQDVSLDSLVGKYRKMLERIADRLGKQVEFSATPGGLELDPHFFTPFDEALMHILRNGVDHGLESTADRLASGKSEVGHIQLKVECTPGNVVLAISDDGRGIDVDAVVRKAVDHDLVSDQEAEAMSESERLELIFGSGVSTAGEVTDLSGRGVGMAAARECVIGLGGRVSVSSKVGVGTTIELTISRR